MMTWKINSDLIDDCLNVFSNKAFSRVNLPAEVFGFSLGDEVTSRVNHMLVKNPHGHFVIPKCISAKVSELINRCFENAKANGIADVDSRYVYLTYDNADVEPGKTQREPGYHIDGMQGDEVPEKVNACFQYIWTSGLPTVFCNQAFDAGGLDPSVHNYFTSLSGQVDETKTFEIKSGSVYFMNPYMVHRGQVARVLTKRVFLRVYFSHLPITSAKATINPDIDYLFAAHSSTGNIPLSLITA